MEIHIKIDPVSAAELTSEIEACVATVSISETLAGPCESSDSVSSTQCRRALGQLSDVALKLVPEETILCHHTPLLRGAVKVSTLF